MFEWLKKHWAWIVAGAGAAYLIYWYLNQAPAASSTAQTVDQGVGYDPYANAPYSGYQGYTPQSIEATGQTVSTGQASTPNTSANDALFAALEAQNQAGLNAAKNGTQTSTGNEPTPNPPAPEPAVSLAKDPRLTNGFTDLLANQANLPKDQQFSPAAIDTLWNTLSGVGPYSKPGLTPPIDPNYVPPAGNVITSGAFTGPSVAAPVPVPGQAPAPLPDNPFVFTMPSPITRVSPQPVGPRPLSTVFKAA